MRPLFLQRCRPQYCTTSLFQEILRLNSSFKFESFPGSYNFLLPLNLEASQISISHEFLKILNPPRSPCPMTLAVYQGHKNFLFPKNEFGNLLDLHLPWLLKNFETCQLSISSRAWSVSISYNFLLFYEFWKFLLVSKFYLSQLCGLVISLNSKILVSPGAT